MDQENGAAKAKEGASAASSTKHRLVTSSSSLFSQFRRGLSSMVDGLWLDDIVFEEYVDAANRGMTPFIAVCLPFVASRMNLDQIGSFSPLWQLAFTFCIGSFLSTQTYSIFLKHRSSPSAESKARVDQLKRIIGSIHLPSLAMVFGQASFATALIARVIAGQCPEDVTLWTSQRCNPEASVHSIPHEMAMFLYVFPIMIIAFMQCASVSYLVFSYVVAFASIFTSLSIVGGMLHVFKALLCITCLAVALQFEKRNR